MRIRAIHHQSEGFEQLATMPGFTSDLPIDSKIEPLYYEMGFLVEKEGSLVARAIVYDNPHHKIDDKSYLCIGYFLCVNDVQIALSFMEHLQAYFRETHHAGFIGPMNGSTWNTYRWVTAGEEKPFFLEPHNASYYTSLFSSIGFKLEWEYFSAIDESIQDKYDEPNPLAEEMAQHGISIETLDKNKWEETLASIGKLSLDSFADNVLYSPISLDDFMHRMRPLVDFIDEAFFLMAMKDGKIIAYLFALRDLLNAGKERLIVKTVARDRSLAIKGIGSYLCFEIVRIAKQKGINDVIHALMYDGNISRFLSKKFSLKKLRSYGLYVLEKKNDE